MSDLGNFLKFDRKRGVGMSEISARIDLLTAGIPPLKRVVQTCVAAPSQWDAWTENDQYLYLRYRHSQGRVEWHPSSDWETWQLSDPVLVRWEDEREPGDRVGSGCIELQEFLDRAGLQLAYGAEVVPYTWPEDDEDEISDQEHEARRQNVGSLLQQLTARWTR